VFKSKTQQLLTVYGGIAYVQEQQQQLPDGQWACQALISECKNTTLHDSLM
jgi:hypothetical protein